MGTLVDDQRFFLVSELGLTESQGAAMSLADLQSSYYAGGGGGGGGAEFKRTVYRHSANYTRLDAAFANIDTVNIPPLSHALEIGDVVRCMLTATFSHAVGNVARLDWLIDRPVSADTAFRTLFGGSSAGVLELGTNSADCNTLTFWGLFTATEAGVHSFVPQWASPSATATILMQGANSSALTHIVEKLGAPVV